MKIRLTQPLVVTIPAGTMLSTTGPDDGTNASMRAFQPVTISLGARTAVVEASGYEAQHLVVAGVRLVEGQRYNLTTKVSYGKRSGESNTLRDWVYNGYDAQSWRGTRLYFHKHQPEGHWGGARRELQTEDILAVEPVS